MAVIKKMDYKQILAEIITREGNMNKAVESLLLWLPEDVVKGYYKFTYVDEDKGELRGF